MWYGVKCKEKVIFIKKSHYFKVKLGIANFLARYEFVNKMSRNWLEKERDFYQKG